jgi:hypothetical protein
MTPTPKFFEPPPPKAPRASSAQYSAPVSREVPSAIPRSEREQFDPTRVHLSVEEKEIARASKISETEYARQKLKRGGKSYELRETGDLRRTEGKAWLLYLKGRKPGGTSRAAIASLAKVPSVAPQSVLLTLTDAFLRALVLL